MSSTSILDYVGRGTHAARPATPPVGSATAVYYETDTTNTFVWTGSAWVQVNGSSGTVTAVTATSPLASSGGTTPAISITSPLPVANGGTGTASPGIVAGTNVTVTGTWPNQTVAASGGGGGTTPYDATILAETSLTHYWKMNETAGATAAVDSQGSVNLTLNGGIVFGRPAITRDGETCAFFPGLTSAYFTFPNTPLIPASGDYTVEFVLHTPLYYADSGFFSGLMIPLSGDASSNFDFHLCAAQGTYVGNNYRFVIGGSAFNRNASMPAMTSTLIHIVASSGSTYIYANGSPLGAAMTATVGRQASAGKLGMSAAATNYPYTGSMAKFAIYNAALTQAQIDAHVANL